MWLFSQQFAQLSLALLLGLLIELLLIPDDRPIVLREGIAGDPEVFGGAAPLVSSDALVLLNISAEIPPAMIAFGSRDEDRFTQEQATELLTFLTKVMSELTRIWLGLPE